MFGRVGLTWGVTIGLLICIAWTVKLRGGCAAVFWLPGVFRPLVSRQWAEHHIDGSANQFWGRIRMPEGGNVFKKSPDQLKPEFGVRHFAPAKLEHNLHLHLFAEEIDRVARLDPQIMRVDFRAELDFLYLIGVLVLFGLFVLLGLFVAEFAEVHKPANRRRGSGGDFHQIHRIGAGQIDRFAERQDSELFAIDSYYPHLAGTNFPVYPDKRSGRRRRAWRKRAAQDTLVGFDLFMQTAIKTDTGTMPGYS
jgi:hypothetical protein